MKSQTTPPRISQVDKNDGIQLYVNKDVKKSWNEHTIVKQLYSIKDVKKKKRMIELPFKDKDKAPIWRWYPARIER